MSIQGFKRGSLVGGTHSSVDMHIGGAAERIGTIAAVDNVEDETIQSEELTLEYLQKNECGAYAEQQWYTLMASRLRDLLYQLGSMEVRLTFAILTRAKDFKASFLFEQNANLQPCTQRITKAMSYLGELPLLPLTKAQTPRELHLALKTIFEHMKANIAITGYPLLRAFHLTEALSVNFAEAVYRILHVDSEFHIQLLGQDVEDDVEIENSSSSVANLEMKVKQDTKKKRKKKKKKTKYDVNLFTLSFVEFQKKTKNIDKIFEFWNDEARVLRENIRKLARKRQQLKYLPSSMKFDHTDLQKRFQKIHSIRYTHERLKKVIANVVTKQRNEQNITDVSQSQSQGGGGSNAAQSGSHSSASQNSSSNAFAKALGSVETTLVQLRLAFRCFIRLPKHQTSRKDKSFTLDLQNSLSIQAWRKAVQKYDNTIRAVENSISRLLTGLLSKCTNSEAMFKVFSQFNTLFYRPTIKEAIQRFQARLIQSVTKDVKQLKRSLASRSGYSTKSSNKKANANSVARRRNSTSSFSTSRVIFELPLVSSEILWAQQIEKKLLGYYANVEDVLGEGWKQESEGQELRNLGDELQRSLDTSSMFMQWRSTIEANLKTFEVKGRVVQIFRTRRRRQLGDSSSVVGGGQLNHSHGVKLPYNYALGVNFSDKAVNLFREVDNLQRLFEQAKQQRLRQQQLANANMNPSAKGAMTGSMGAVTNRSFSVPTTMSKAIDFLIPYRIKRLASEAKERYPYAVWLHRNLQSYGELVRRIRLADTKFIDSSTSLSSRKDDLTIGPLVAKSLLGIQRLLYVSLYPGRKDQFDKDMMMMSRSSADSNSSKQEKKKSHNDSTNTKTLGVVKWSSAKSLHNLNQRLQDRIGALNKLIDLCEISRDYIYKTIATELEVRDYHNEDENATTLKTQFNGRLGERENHTTKLSRHETNDDLPFNVIDDRKVTLHHDKLCRTILDIERVCNRLAEENCSNLKPFMSKVQALIDAALYERCRDCIQAFGSEYHLNNTQTRTNKKVNLPSGTFLSKPIVHRIVMQNESMRDTNIDEQGEDDSDDEILQQRLSLFPTLSQGRRYLMERFQKLCLKPFIGLPVLVETKDDIGGFGGKYYSSGFGGKYYSSEFLLSQLKKGKTNNGTHAHHDAEANAHDISSSGSLLAIAHERIENIIKNLQNYTETEWLPYQGLWEMETNNRFNIILQNQLGSNLEKWHSLLQEMFTKIRVLEEQIRRDTAKSSNNDNNVEREIIEDINKSSHTNQYHIESKGNGNDELMNFTKENQNSRREGYGSSAPQDITRRSLIQTWGQGDCRVTLDCRSVANRVLLKLKAWHDKFLIKFHTVQQKQLFFMLALSKETRRVLEVTSLYSLQSNLLMQDRDASVNGSASGGEETKEEKRRAVENNNNKNNEGPIKTLIQIIQVLGAFTSLKPYFEKDLELMAKGQRLMRRHNFEVPSSIESNLLRGTFLRSSKGINNNKSLKQSNLSRKRNKKHAISS